MVTTAHRLGLAAVVFAFALPFALLLGGPAHADAVPPPSAHALADDLFEALKVTPIAAPPAGMAETAEERLVRLRSIADDAAAVGKADGAATLLLAVAEHESAFALDVDRGPCRPKTCDGGHAACMLQIHGGSVARNDELFTDRRDCFSTGLRALGGSRAVCRSLGAEYQFASYASGSCVSPAGQKASAELFASWQKWQARLASVRARRQ